VKAWINDGNAKFSNHFTDFLSKIEMEEIFALRQLNLVKTP